MDYSRLQTVLPDIQRQIEEAALRSGRTGAEVTLVAVTKGHPVEVVTASLEAGLRDLGENRVEALEERAAAFGGGGIRWHMVGHLQSRKAARAAAAATLIHSVDSLKLAERLGRGGVETGSPVAILVQVNTAGEDSKSGLDPTSGLDALGAIVEVPGVRVEGLMTMAPFTDDEAVLREAFQALRRLHEEARRQVSDYGGTHLSMGMSNDFILAVEEGSTMVRLGTALFGERPA